MFTNIGGSDEIYSSFFIHEHVFFFVLLCMSPQGFR